MGTSYQTLLVAAALPAVVAELAAAGITGAALQAGPDRTAVLPREDDFGYADTERMGRWISRRFGHPTLGNVLIDSDVVVLCAFRAGEQIHQYVSEQSMLVDWFMDDQDRSRFRIGDVDQPEDAVPPTGPLGTDPDALAPFGVGEVDRERLRAALEGDVDRTLRAALDGEDPDWLRSALDATPIWAELQHRLILEALNLDPAGLTTAFRYGVEGGVAF